MKVLGEFSYTPKVGTEFAIWSTSRQPTSANFATFSRAYGFVFGEGGRRGSAGADRRVRLPEDCPEVRLYELGAVKCRASPRFLQARFRPTSGWPTTRSESPLTMYQERKRSVK